MERDQEAAPADPGDAGLAELVALEDDWARAIVTNDSGRIAEFMTAEWVTDVFLREQGRWRCALTHITAAAPA